MGKGLMLAYFEIMNIVLSTPALPVRGSKA